MAKTTEDDGGGGELGIRTSSYSNAMTDDTVPPPAAGKPERKGMSFSSHPELKELDTDGDGTIDEVDLLRLLKLKHHEENIIREQRYGLLCLIVVIIGVGLGLGLELKNSKEATNDAIEDARLGVTQAHEVVVPTEFYVGTTVEFQENGPDEPASSVDLKDKMGNPIRPDRSLDKIKLTSELPDSAFAELERIQIEGVAGSINFKTQGFGRYTAPDSRCGSVVIVYTTMGSVQFDGTSMMFDEQVAGAFDKAGFRVSGALTRARRTRTARSRRTAEMDENNYSLIGVNRMFGEFAFIANVDLSSLTCGDERPSIKSPFDGDVWDIQTEEDELHACGEGSTECPTTAPLIEGFKGETYFKRTVRMRAKKVDGVWRSIRATTFPDLNNDPAAPAQYRDGQYVEISNGVQGQIYQYWPNDKSGSSPNGTNPVFTHCESNVSTVDRSEAIEANSTDIPENAYAIDFIGYDVLNNHYVKHFRVYNLNPDTDLSDVDYLESFDNDRMYSVQLLQGHWNTYETIKTNGDVDPTFLQGAGYPDIDAANFGDDASDPVPCADDVLYNAIEEGGNYTYDQLSALQQERDAAAQTPDLGHYLSEAWDISTHELTVARQLEVGKDIINSLFDGWDEDTDDSASVFDFHANLTDTTPEEGSTDPVSGDGEAIDANSADDPDDDGERRSRSVSAKEEEVTTSTSTEIKKRAKRDLRPVVLGKGICTAPGGLGVRVYDSLPSSLGDEALNAAGTLEERVARCTVKCKALPNCARLGNGCPLDKPHKYPGWTRCFATKWDAPRCDFGATADGAHPACTFPGAHPSCTSSSRGPAVTVSMAVASWQGRCYCNHVKDEDCTKWEHQHEGFVRYGLAIPGKIGTKTECAACFWGELGKELRSDGVSACKGYCSTAGYCGLSYDWKNNGIDCTAGHDSNAEFTCAACSKGQGCHGFCSRWGWCGNTPAYKGAGSLDCRGGGVTEKAFTAPVAHPYQNSWCNYDKVFAAAPIWQYGTNHECIAACRKKTGCGWVGHRRADNYCEFWKSSSCRNAHAQPGHDIYLVDDTPEPSTDQIILDVLKRQTESYKDTGCVGEKFTVMGDNPYLTVSAQACKERRANKKKKQKARGNFMDVQLEMGGHKEIFDGFYTIKAKGTIIGTLGTMPYTTNPKTSRKPFLKFEGRAELEWLGPINVKLSVSAIYQFTVGTPNKHRITLAGAVKVSGSCRRRRRHGYEAELRGVLQRNRRWFHQVAIDWTKEKTGIDLNVDLEKVADAGGDLVEAGKTVGGAVVQTVNEVGKAAEGVVNKVAGAITEFAEDVVDAVKELVCDSSITATLTFYYQRPNVALLKADFPKKPKSVKLRVDVKFLIFKGGKTFNLGKKK